MKMQSNDRFLYIVTGKGQFPTDMLRYDDSTAARPEDQAIIDSDEWHRTRQKVALVTTSRHTPTKARWSSFLWVAWEPRRITARDDLNTLIHREMEKVI